MSSGTGTTPTLTPTTLQNLEQTFIELQSVPHHGGTGGTPGAANGGCDPHTQSGFVPPVVDPSSREQSMDSFESDPEWEPALKMGRGPGGVLVMGGGDSQSASTPQRKYTRRSRNEKLSPEEEERRSVRRERNKLAAAKCRQRRVDHTNCLVEETEKLETVRSDLENEIQSLQQQKDQLEFLLQAHVPLCKVDPSAATIKIKAEPSESNHLGTSSMTRPSSSAPSSRPTSLPLEHHQQNSGGSMSEAESSGYYSYSGLDSLVDGSTGLTPLAAGPGVSCSNQLHRSESDNGAEAVSSGMLIQL
ncbi:hypothetical protein ACOMHN_026552 [Nucella lapillus]